MSITKILCCTKSNFEWKKKFDVAQKVIWCRQKQVNAARKIASCQQKQLMLHKGSISYQQKHDAAQKNILCSKKLFVRMARHRCRLYHCPS